VGGSSKGSGPAFNIIPEKFTVTGWPSTVTVMGP
jgi:hypothetical protein